MSQTAIAGGLRQAGHEVAVIFGSLPPEVRRREAARFASGAADVLVATDAIGLGLNLPIHRVIFGALEKFDGVEQRPLTLPEIRQIAGRAGRGAGELGYAGVVRGRAAVNNDFRMAAAVADRIEETSDLDASFCLSAPISSRDAIIPGETDLYKAVRILLATGSWPIPAAPKKTQLGPRTR